MDLHAVVIDGRGDRCNAAALQGRGEVREALGDAAGSADKAKARELDPSVAG